MTFRNQGFLSHSLNDWAKKAHHDFDEWFGLAEKLNRVAMNAIFEGQPSQSSDRELLTAVLFGRALQSFQGAILLAEHGMLTDARTLVRSCVESTIALGGTSEIPGFIDCLIEDHYKHRKTIANSLLNSSEYAADLSSNQVSKLQQLLIDIKTQYPDHKLRSINWEETALKSGLLVLYNTIYRETSGNSAHVTLDSLNWHIQSDSDGNIEALSFGPKSTEMVGTLSGAINTLLFAGIFFINTFKLTNIEAEWKSCLTKWQTLTAANTESPI